MNRSINYGLRVLKWVLIVVAVIWLGLWILIALNTGKLKAILTDRIREKTLGIVSMEKISPEFLHTFPFISIDISNLTIRDSLWSRHKKDLFTAKHVYLRVSPFSLLSKQKISKVIARDGAINIFTDSSGYTNQYILTPRNKKRVDPESAPSYPKIELDRMTIAFEYPQRNKLHRIFLRKLRYSVTDDDGGQYIKVSAKLRVDMLAFNTTKGSYMPGKNISGDFKLFYNKSGKLLNFSNILLYLDGEPFHFTGNFSLVKMNPAYSLSIIANHVNYTKAAGLLPAKISSKLLSYSFKKPVSFTVDITGKTEYLNKPAVSVHMNIVDDNLTTPFGELTNCSFKSFFVNEVDPSRPHADENSSIQISNLLAKWESIPVESDTLRITNLVHPFLEFSLRSNFPLKSLNDLTGSNTLEFLKGTSNINILFHGPLQPNDSLKASITGDIALSDASFRYIPRNFTMTNGNGTIHFRDKDLVVDKLKVSTGKSTITMNGSAENFLSLLNIEPEKLQLQWNISSPHLFLNDFKGFLSQKSKSTASSKKAVFKNTAGKIDRMFTEGDVTIELKTPRLSYHRFEATDVAAVLLLTANQVSLKQVFLHHAKGSIKLNGIMKEANPYNTIQVKSVLNKLDIPDLFDAFNDFGQDALTSKNLKGQISANVVLNAAITDKAEMVRKETAGTIDFLVENGELNHFEPIEKISETALKKQDFSKIKFADLKNRLEIKGTAFIINKMEIRSSAFTMFVQGIYDVANGTDMSIQFPIRNLTSSQANTDLSLKGKKGAGLSVHLRAKTGNDGKLNVSWDPFKKAVKKQEQIKDSLDKKR